MQASGGDDRDSFQRITPRQPTPLAKAAAPVSVAAAPRGLIGGLLALVLVLCLIVFYLLSVKSGMPETAQLEADVPAPSANPAKAATASPPADEDVAGAELSVIDAETGLANRRAAAEVGAALRLRLKELVQRDVLQWAREPWTQLDTLAREGQVAFDERRYVQAREKWIAAMPMADSLMDQLGWEYLGALQQGQQFLDDGDSESAQAAFQRALAINPTGEEAQQGLAQARALDEVMVLLNAAADSERRKDWVGARAKLEQAASLSPSSGPVQQALARMVGIIDDLAFRRSISQANAALERGDYRAARRAYNDAGEIRKGDPAVTQGLQDLELRQQLDRIAQLQNSARGHEVAERWAEAMRDYKALLVLDGNLSFARDGLSRSEKRAALDKALQGFINDPDRLFKEKERDVADVALAEARAISAPGRRLRGQIDWMQKALALAREPVAVELVSDNRSDVLLYRVGKLGRFDRKLMDIMPGDYTVIGRCPGHRDSRQQFQVRPGSGQVGPIQIVCGEVL